jgi:hypothetical protein
LAKNDISVPDSKKKQKILKKFGVSINPHLEQGILDSSRQFGFGVVKLEIDGVKFVFEIVVFSKTNFPDLRARCQPDFEICTNYYGPSITERLRNAVRLLVIPAPEEFQIISKINELRM